MFGFAQHDRVLEFSALPGSIFANVEGAKNRRGDAGV